MARVTIKNSLRKSDNGKYASASSEIVLVDHSDYGLTFAIMSSGASITALFDDLSEADSARNGYSTLQYGIKPIDMSETVDVKRASKKLVKSTLVSSQKISECFIKTARVLYSNKTAP